ncbi:hypothetical protein [Aquimarina algiphila]|uniref:Uncharacterized protein n=1 Tax=Aquimarina algiphila TaxID=2047982 RepID=A0A554VHJ9_9FLAO|nr:hypothetical protein [Aquimarina algiphila]TSE06975.1 hypothetical protein FOF46_17275 [Aquimarina algiphila]
MSVYIFKQLNLNRGDLIYIQNEKGEGINGSYEGEYNPSNESFKFSNFNYGKTEIIYLDKLQALTRL